MCSLQVSPLNNRTAHCTGRTNSSLLSPHFIRLGIGRPAKVCSIIPPRSEVVFLPVSTRRAHSLSCLPSLSTLSESSETSIPFLLANACAALVGLPSASKATFTGGPQETLSVSGVRISRDLTIMAKRLGAANEST